MARILYGLMGDAFGHVFRALAVAEELSEHEIVFLGGGRVLTLREQGYPVEELSMLSTAYRNNQVDITATVRNGIDVFLGYRTIVQRVVDMLKDFNPAVVMTDYEYFAPVAARRLGIPVVSIDNQHFLTHCRCPLPEGQMLSRTLFTLPLRYLYSNADHYFVSTFFQPVPINPSETEVVPPVLRRGIREHTPRAGDHVLVYQTSPTFAALLPVLEEIPRPFVIYGMGDRRSSKNLTFKAPSRETFLEDLASCRYAIINGGHNVISEALFFGKPILAFPIRLAYEQYFNACMVERLGYGSYCTSAKPDPTEFLSFEKGLEGYRTRIAQGQFFGNDKLGDGIRKFLARTEGVG
jgi:uncharacterized protein (TIGR00661 family)